MSSLLAGRVDQIDTEVESIHRLIEGASKEDPEMAAGLATTEAMTAIQRKLDQFAAAVDTLDKQLRALGSR
jgi:septal ring factor EnvC (AmiA/AmiB activator)